MYDPEQSKRYREQNKDRVKQQRREYYERNKDKIKEKATEYYNSNAEDVKAKRREREQRDKERLKQQRRQYRERHREQNRHRDNEWRENNRDRFREISLASYYRDIARRLYNGAKQRATKNNIPFDIERDDIVVPSHCPVFGTELTWGIGDKSTSPSLDRIIPEKGYVKGNVEVISWVANKLKSNATLHQLEMLCEYVRLHTDICPKNAVSTLENGDNLGEV